MTSEAVTIEFKGRHDHITERMQAHASKKLARLLHFSDQLIRIEIVADHAHESPEVELIVHQRRGQPLVARDRGRSFAATIDLLVDKMEAQLRKKKEKRKTAKRVDKKVARGGRAAAGRSKGASEEETYEQVVRKSLRS